MTDKLPNWLNPQVSIGNIIQGLMLIVAISIAWGSLRSEQIAQSRRVEALERATAERELRIRGVEISQAGTASDVRSIQAGIARIETLLDSLTKQRQGGPN
jgi:hypothetical protein